MKKEKESVCATVDTDCRREWRQARWSLQSSLALVSSFCKWSSALFIILILISSFTLAANDPGHDELYIESTGDSLLTGALNISNELKVANLFYSSYLDVLGNGSQPQNSYAQIYTPNNGNNLILNAPTGIYLAKDSGSMVYVGTSSVDLNISGDSYVTGNSYVGGLKVCLSDGTNCINGNNTGNVSSVSAGNGISISGTNDVTVAVDTSSISACTGSTQKIIWDSGNNRLTCGTDQNSDSISGSGASNRLAFWTGSGTISYDNNITWDNTNKRLGIGTSNPNDDLHLVGDFRLGDNSDYNYNIRAYSNRPSGGQNLLTLSSNWNNNEVAAIAFRTGVDTTNKDDGRIAIYTAPDNSGIQERLTIRENGNVGIGTTSPNYKLHVNGSIYAGSDSSSYIYLESTGVSGRKYSLITGTTGEASFYDNSNSKYVWRYVNNDLMLYANGINLMKLDDSGNVGIGTTIPTQTLDVNGSINISDSASKIHTPELCLNGDCQTSWPSGTGGTSLWTNSSGNATFVSGNVGIGTTSPEFTLDIDGTTRKYAEGSSSYMLYDVFSDTDGDANQFAMRKAGGTKASPTAVVNDERVGIFTWQGYDGNSYGEVAKIGAFLDDTVADGNTSGRLVFYTTGVGASSVTERMRIDSNGNVGIGTAAPASDLHITDTGSPQIRLTYDTTTDQTYMLGVNTAVNGYFTIKDITDDTDRLVIDGNGNVGIGTTSIPYKLVINAKAGGGDGIILRNNTGALKAYLWVDTAGASDLNLYNSTNSRSVRIRSEGDSYITGSQVGIGTTTPGEALDVVGNINASGDICLNSGECLSSAGGTSTLSEVLVAGNSAGSTSLNMNGQDILSANNIQVNGQISDSADSTVTVNDNLVVIGTGDSSFAGNVGIGTTNPTSKLHVKNTITDTSSSATSYRLRSDFSASTSDVTSQEDGSMFEMYSAGNYDHSNIRSLISASYNNGGGNIATLTSGTFGGGVLSTGNITTYNIISANTYGTGSGVIGTVSALKIGDLGAYNSPTNMYGVNVAANTGAVGTSKFGLYIGEQSGASTNNFNIYSVGTNSKNYFQGKIGIGTSSPDSLLHVNKASGDAIITLEQSGDGYSSGIDFLRERTTGTGVNGGSIFMDSNSSTNNALLYIQAQTTSAQAGVTGDLIDGNGARILLEGGLGKVNIDEGDFVVNNSNLYVDVSSGNVGIGTSSPSSALDVVGNMRLKPGTTDDGIIVTETDSSTSAISLTSNTVRGSLSINNAGTKVISLNGATASSYINTGGSFGIGTNNPGDALHINGTYGTGIILERSSTPSKWAIGVGENVAGDFRIKDINQDATRLQILSSGNIGIGTTSPSTALHVNGTITVESSSSDHTIGDSSGDLVIKAASSGNVIIELG